MFCLNVALGNVSWRLLFKDVDTAKVAFTILDARNGPDIKIEDDFGQTLVAHVDSMHGLMLEDMEATKLAHVEMALHQERTRVLATKMALSCAGESFIMSLSPSGRRCSAASNSDAAPQLRQSDRSPSWGFSSPPSAALTVSMR